MSIKKPNPLLRKRGRKPLDDTVIRKNIVIANAVDQLIIWGFSGKGEVFEAVGIAAMKVLDRKVVGPRDTPLGPDSVKKIWEEHAPEGWERYWPIAMKKASPKPARRSQYTKESLTARRPSGTLTELAEELLKRNGVWPTYEMDDAVYRGDLEPSKKWAEQLGFYSPKNGVKK